MTIAILVSGVSVLVAGYLFSNKVVTSSDDFDSSKSTIKSSPNSDSIKASYSSSLIDAKKIKQASLSQNSKINIDVGELAQYVGEDTATALAKQGPFEPRHVRTIAHSLKNMEMEINELLKKNETQSAQAMLMPYYQLQNHYYAVLNELEPYNPNNKSAKRLIDFEERIRREGSYLSESEQADLKREMLLLLNGKGLNSAH